MFPSNSVFNSDGQSAAWRYFTSGQSVHLKTAIHANHCKPLQTLCKPQYHIRVAKLQFCHDLPAFHTMPCSPSTNQELSHSRRLSLAPDNACVEFVTTLRQKQTPWEKRLLRCRQSPSTWHLSYRLAWSVPTSHRTRQNCVDMISQSQGPSSVKQADLNVDRSWHESCKKMQKGTRIRDCAKQCATHTSTSHLLTLAGQLSCLCFIHRQPTGACNLFSENGSNLSAEWPHCLDTGTNLRISVSQSLNLKKTTERNWAVWVKCQSEQSADFQTLDFQGRSPHLATLWDTKRGH